MHKKCTFGIYTFIFRILFYDYTTSHCKCFFWNHFLLLWYWIESFEHSWMSSSIGLNCIKSKKKAELSVWIFVKRSIQIANSLMTEERRELDNSIVYLVTRSLIMNKYIINLLLHLWVLVCVVCMFLGGEGGRSLTLNKNLLF